MAVMSSANYKIDYEEITSGGNIGQSGNYQEMDSIGEIGNSLSAGDNYKAGAGLNYGIQSDKMRTPALANNGSENSLNFTINRGDDNPSDAEYAIAIIEAGTATFYIQADNSIGSAMIWQTYANWGSASGETVMGLKRETEYAIKVKARHGDFTETEWSAEASATTSRGNGIFIPPAPPEIGPGGDYPDFPNPEKKEESEIPISIIINNDSSFTNSRNVILTLSAKGAAQVSISNNIDFNGIGWEDFSAGQTEADVSGFTKAEKPWTLIGGNPAAPYGAVRTVYAKFRSKNGGETKIVSDSIILDSMAPSNASNFKAEWFTHPSPSQDGNITSSKDRNEENLLLKEAAEGWGMFLTWNNPLEDDFSRVKIFRSEKFYPDEPIEGGEWENVLIYEGSGTSYVDLQKSSAQEYGASENGLHGQNGTIEPTDSNGKQYYYTIFAYDFASNNSSGAVWSETTGGSESVEPLEASPKASPEVPEYPPFLPGPKIVHILKLSDVSFFVDGRKIFLDEKQIAKIPSMKQAKISISAEKLSKALKTIFVTIRGEEPKENFYYASYLLKINERKTAYEADIITPKILGIYFFNLSVMNFEDGTVEKLSARFLVNEDIYFKNTANIQDGLKNAYEYSKKNWLILTVFAVFLLLILILARLIVKRIYRIL